MKHLGRLCKHLYVSRREQVIFMKYSSIFGEEYIEYKKENFKKVSDCTDYIDDRRISGQLRSYFVDRTADRLLEFGCISVKNGLRNSEMLITHILLESSKIKCRSCKSDEQEIVYGMLNKKENTLDIACMNCLVSFTDLSEGMRRELKNIENEVANELMYMRYIKEVCGYIRYKNDNYPTLVEDINNNMDIAKSVFTDNELAHITTFEDLWIPMPLKIITKYNNNLLPRIKIMGRKLAC